MASGRTSFIRYWALWLGLPSTMQRSNDLGQPSQRIDKSSQAASAPLLIKRGHPSYCDKQCSRAVVEHVGVRGRCTHESYGAHHMMPKHPEQQRGHIFLLEDVKLLLLKTDSTLKTTNREQQGRKLGTKHISSKILP